MEGTVKVNIMKKKCGVTDLVVGLRVWVSGWL
jgi:hypothetical protein